MGYRCQICNSTVSGSASRTIAETKVKYYSFRPKANPGFQTKNGQVLRPLRKSRKRMDRVDDPGGKGWEIKKEIMVCPKCAKDHKESS